MLQASYADLMDYISEPCGLLERPLYSLAFSWMVLHSVSCAARRIPELICLSAGSSSQYVTGWFTTAQSLRTNPGFTICFRIDWSGH